ncbi:PKD domain-containing protein [Arthrobacter sp.]|uniref:PKD domain-containing protein n=1 Tax=Arthrobacter sp. TaxID=1667 RepID=UPI00258EA5AE|nr:PKD domain-containing protein [Arthrobacter sp.]
MKSILRRLAVGIAAVAVVLGMTAAPAWAKQTTLSALSTPTWQTNATVRAVAYAAGKVFVGGEFTTVRPPGAAAGVSETSRTYLAVFDAATGDLLGSAPQPNGKVWSLTASADGTTVYAGGDFTQIYGAARGRIAAIDTANLTLRPAFKPYVAYRVSTIDVAGPTIYFGGSFTQVAGVDRPRAAAVQASDGALLPWNPAPDADVNSVKASPDGSKVYLGGKFAYVGSVHRESVALVDAQQGALLPFPAASTLPDRTGSCWTKVEDIITHGDNVYFANAGDGGGCFDGTWSASIGTGQLNWKNTCLGATEAIVFVGEWLYKGSHAHDCSSMGGFPQGPNRFLLAEKPDTGDVQGWYPQTNAGPSTYVGPWDMATDGQHLWVGGDFTTVNGVGQQGLTMFGSESDAPPKKPATPSAASLRAGQVDVRVTATLDNDDEYLNYKVFRNGSSTPLDVRTVRSRFWDIPSYRITDPGLTPGSQVAYRVEVTDGTNVVTSYWTPYITVASQNAGYSDNVVADGAQYFWPTDESSGTSAHDAIAGNNLTGSNRTQLGSAGPNATSKSVNIQNSNASLNSSVQLSGPNTFSVEAWINTTSLLGGKVVGFGNTSSGSSSQYDRHLYVDSGGRPVFGVYPGYVVTVRGGSAVNDGKWHHLVGTLGGGNATLYVDGVSQGSSPAAGAEGYTGYWRIGANNLGAWPNQPLNQGIVGRVSQVAVYSSALDASQVAWHNSLGRGNQAPVAAFTPSCTLMACSFNASASNDPDGTITSYAWDFGDGATGAGVNTSHTYASAGTWNVRLTVKDNLGATTVTSQTVTTTAPNQPPVASATSSCTYLVCSFDASASSDPDGTIASYAWTFGDGTTGTGATPQHSYAAAGTYTATVTVTDNDGAQNSAGTTVTVAPQPANQPPVASAAASCTQLACTFDASASSDPDGSIVSYAWTFGDGTTGTGVTPSHTYSAPGVYTATVTVTDNRGGTASASKQLDLSNAVPAGTVLAKDTFARTVTNGWGTADKGGAWTVSGTASRYAVSGGQGTLTMLTAGNQTGAALNSFSAQDTEVSLGLSLDKPATGGGVYVSVDSRTIAGQGAYRAKVRYIAAGRVYLSLIRVDSAGTETVLVPETQVLAATPAAGNTLQVKFLVSGSGTTTLKAKAWDSSGAEPGAWQLSTTDGTAGLQAAGSPALRTTLSGSSTNAPVQARVTDYLVTTPR